MPSFFPLPPVSGPFRPFRGHGRRFVRPERATAWCGDRRFLRSPGLFQELEDLLDGDGEDPGGEAGDDLSVSLAGTGKRA